MQEKKDLSCLRHSISHLLAAAVTELYPETRPTLGPPTEAGFYYDFDFGEHSVGDEDLVKIEARMKEILPNWETFQEIKVSAEEAKQIFKNNSYKLELIKEFEAEDKNITLYYSGPKDRIPTKDELLTPNSLQLTAGFMDLCQGGHLDDLSQIDPRAFKLTSIAGAYWRGDENNKMLTRIYGTAFFGKEELDKYLEQLEEAKKRDHRRLGKDLDLFTFSEHVGAGLPLFTPKGTAMRNAIVDKIYDIQKKFDYQQVWIPHITKPNLYRISGHWEKFGDELLKVQGKDSEFVMKPMNCPHHTQIYASQAKSYRDLPIRLVEATTNYRDEQTGELLGLSRVRSLTQDDGHVFCTPEQVKTEIENISEVVKEFYTSLDMYGQDSFRVFLSVRDPEKPDDYLGDPKRWQEAEDILKTVAEGRGLSYLVEEGEAAFYGPKLDFMFSDALGREWQLATIQLDFVMPERFGLEYVDQDGQKKTPVMIHRAIAGSLERFLSVIIEHFAGAFPFWLSPVQVKILPINENHRRYAREVYRQLRESDFRAEIDESDESLGKKIRQVKLEKIPYFLVIGDNEVKKQTVTLEGREGKVGEKSLETLLHYFEDNS